MIPEARTWPERCPGCGFHVATQGDACNGTLKWERPSGLPDEWSIFLAALRQAAKGSEVHQRDVRPLVRNRIASHHVGLCYRRAIREGLLTEVRRERSDDVIGRNTNKLEPVYSLRGAA